MKKKQNGHKNGLMINVQVLLPDLSHLLVLKNILQWKFLCYFLVEKRGLLQGLTFSNELISRDEALHTEFAVLLYDKLEKKISKKKVQEIIIEAVTIEKEFICESLQHKHWYEFNINVSIY